MRCRPVGSARVKSHRLMILFFKNRSFLFFGPFFTDPRALGYEETVIITLATVSVLAVLAVAAFFGYRMMHGEFNAAARRRFFFVPFKKKKWTYSLIFSLFFFGEHACMFFCANLEPCASPLPSPSPRCVCVCVRRREARPSQPEHDGGGRLRELPGS